MKFEILNMLKSNEKLKKKKKKKNTGECTGKAEGLIQCTV